MVDIFDRYPGVSVFQKSTQTQSKGNLAEKSAPPRLLISHLVNVVVVNNNFLLCCWPVAQQQRVTGTTRGADGAARARARGRNLTLLG